MHEKLVRILGVTLMTSQVFAIHTRIVFGAECVPARLRLQPSCVAVDGHTHERQTAQNSDCGGDRAVYDDAPQVAVNPIALVGESVDARSPHARRADALVAAINAALSSHSDR